MLFNGQEIWIQARSVRGALDDNHTKMMRKYKRVPEWWYMVFLLTMIGMSFGTVLGWPTHLSWWALIIGLLIALVWTIPIGIIFATTNIHLGLNVFTEYIVGYMQPGRPVAMMLFKTYGYITMNQAHAFLSDLKLGHYLKIPQRVTFFGQIAATLWSCLVQLAVMEWGLNHIKDVCKEGQANNFTCPNVSQVCFAHSSLTSTGPCFLQCFCYLWPDWTPAHLLWLGAVQVRGIRRCVCLSDITAVVCSTSGLLELYCQYWCMLVQGYGLARSCASLVHRSSSVVWASYLQQRH